MARLIVAALRRHDLECVVSAAAAAFLICYWHQVASTVGIGIHEVPDGFRGEFCGSWQRICELGQRASHSFSSCGRDASAESS
eukprot:863082-Amphidinium_carterae.2